jgi:hypothetical protein
MTIEAAFQLFRSCVEMRGLSDIDECFDPASFGSRHITVRRAGGALRLVWDGKESTLTIEITHGPPGGPTFWLDLFHARGCNEENIPAWNGDISFRDAVAYGIELMQPSRGGEAA